MKISKQQIVTREPRALADPEKCKEGLTASNVPGEIGLSTSVDSQYSLVLSAKG